MADIAARISSCWESDTEVIVSGTSGAGVKYDRLPGVVATIDRERRRVTAIKIWPDDENIENGKVWFAVKDITAFEIVDEEG